MSHLLYALFVNGIEYNLLANGCSYINIDNDALDNSIQLLVVMYAEHTILIADSEENVQKAITCMEIYSGTWKLIVYETKTKVIICDKTKVKKHIKFIYIGVKLELVHNFKYLGLIINFNVSFKPRITELKNRPLWPCMYSLVNIEN